MAVVVWVLICAGLNVSGWLLSSLDRLSWTGYALLLPLLVIASLIVSLRVAGPFRCGAAYVFCRVRWRLRHLFPLAFVVLAVMAIFGGILHAPNNYDALAYRVPRVLNWIAEGHWHWIHTMFHRLNTRACGMEWFSAPLIILTGSDRLLFLPNAVSFLLMPGLVYSVLFRLGVAKRVAWQWMWILPTGYCYLLQAGSIGNDLFGAVLGLCAMDLALRARESGRVSLLLLSVLAAGAMSAGKTNNITLGLAWLVIVGPVLWKSLIHRFILITLVSILAAAASFLPSAFLNYKYCGDWSGSKVEGLDAFTKGHPLQREFHNLLLTLLQNFTPPFFPLTASWDRWISSFVPSSYLESVKPLFEASSARFQMTELQMEEVSSVGFGICLLLAFGIVFSAGAKHLGWKLPSVSRPDRIQTLVVVLSAVGFCIYCAKSGFSGVGRYFGFYFLYIVPALLWLPGFRALVLRRFWKALCCLVFVMAAMLLVISPARPLWPVGIILKASQGGAIPLPKGFLQRIEAVYSTYAERNRAFAPLLARIPSEEKVLGLVTCDDPETSLWKPFGKRVIKHITPDDTAETLRSRGVRMATFDPTTFRNRMGMPYQAWLSGVGGRECGRITLLLRAGAGPIEWIIVQFDPKSDN